jgi:hypothetical protein
VRFDLVNFLSMVQKERTTRADQHLRGKPADSAMLGAIGEGALRHFAVRNKAKA